MRVLIVEDAPDEAELYADVVAQRGHDPILVASAEAALDGLGGSAPDVVLLDLSLPGMNGLEFLRIVRERQPRLPVVVLSGLATEEQARRCLELGAVEFLPKPLPVAQLEMVLDLIEARLLATRLTEDIQSVNRRRYPRAQVSLDVTVEDLRGGQWQGQSVDLSPFGVKVRSAAVILPGDTSRLSFSLPDGGPPISVLSLMIRKDPDGQAFAFINLTNPDFKRLKDFVDSRLRAA